MIEELVFTSAERGLQVGKKGFCTVASTPGMAANLARVLESLSGYRHLFKPNSENSNLNPVVYSHLQQRIGGQDFSILSRIADAGSDYSNRSNKLAHHLAVKAEERGVAGPTSILSNDEIFFQRWNEDPRRLPSRQLPDEVNSNLQCQFWEKVAGDAGWAGGVAGAILDGRTVYVIRNLNTPALELAHEAIRLLPIPKQWGTSFTTFFTKLPPKFECQLRFVVKGTPEVALARRSEANFVVDLTDTLPPCNGKHAVEARNGTPILGADKITLTPKPRTPKNDSQLEGETSPVEPVESAASSKKLPDLAPPVRRRKPPRTSPSDVEHYSANEKNRSIFSAPWMPLVALVFGVLAAGLPSFLFFQTADSDSKSKVADLTNLVQEKEVEFEKYKRNVDGFLAEVAGADNFEQVVGHLDALAAGKVAMEERLQEVEEQLRESQKENVAQQDKLEKLSAKNAVLKKRISNLDLPTIADFVIPEDSFSQIEIGESSTIFKTNRNLSKYLESVRIEFKAPEQIRNMDAPNLPTLSKDEFKMRKSNKGWSLIYKDELVANIRFEENRLGFFPNKDELAKPKLKVICNSDKTRLKISIKGDNTFAAIRHFAATKSLDCVYKILPDTNENGEPQEQEHMEPFGFFDKDKNIKFEFVEESSSLGK